MNHIKNLIWIYIFNGNGGCEPSNCKQPKDHTLLKMGEGSMIARFLWNNGYLPYYMLAYSNYEIIGYAIFGRQVKMKIYENFRCANKN